ncbi:MAG: carbonic anhydrase family protein [Candidatus Marinimicrobia bacterium]|nr:carbonic anhydrase family protein [Candidatus Neomarinimicrobiota bacterium]
MVILLSDSTFAQSGHSAPHWTYDGRTGPGYWGDLDHAFEECLAGRSQSPINISSGTDASLEKIHFSYAPTPLNIVNNGHTIQVNYAEGSYVTIGRKTYDLLQFHFHSPSEHTVDGAPYDMVAHLVHSSRDGELAVVGILMKAGRKSEIIGDIWSHMPKKEGAAHSIRGVTVDASDLVPHLSGFYAYSGSLTTPPCSEGVRWFVMLAPHSVSRSQVRQFVDIFPRSTRPTQPLNGREIWADIYSR